MKKRWKKQMNHPLLEETLSQQLEIDPFLARMLANRGLTACMILLK